MAELTKKEEEKKVALRTKLREQTVGYITAAFGLIAGLAWNDAVKTLIEQVYPAGKGNDVLAKFWYAGIITVVVVIISYFLLKFIESGSKNDK